MRALPFVVVLALCGCAAGDGSGPDEGPGDGASACTESLWFRDADGDGYGNPSNTVLACEAEPGTVGNGSDCDDADPLVQRPHGFWKDRDRDGFGNAAAPVEACEQPLDAVTNDLDCDDARADVKPGASEVCNTLDDDCDGSVDGPDALDAKVFWEDLDQDGHAATDTTVSVEECTPPEGFAEVKDDCDDLDPDAHPGAAERCGGGDEDCDGTTDTDATDAITWYRDDDGDGVGGSTSHISCESGAGWVEAGGDCDDADPAVSPDAAETCNGIDDDCDGSADEPFADAVFDGTIAGLTINGDGKQAWTGTDGFVALTDAASQTSTMWLDEVVPGSFYASLRFSASGGSGGEGLAFAFLDETDPTLLGNDDTGLGVEGLSGFAVVLDTAKNSGTESRDDWLSLRDAADFSVLVTGDTIPVVHDGGEQTLEIWLDGADLTVAIDGTTYLTATLSGALPSSFLVGVTAATSTRYDTHAIDDLLVGCAP
jgi:hypothetical protein